MEFPYGTIVTDLPPNFMPPEAWPEFGAVAYPPSICRRETVGMEPGSVRWSLWPLTFEVHIGDTEPDLEKLNKEGSLNYNRVVMWRRVRRRDTPPGWRAGAKPWRTDGYHELAEGINYITQWSKHARRDARQWQEKLRSRVYAIEEITLEEFVSFYKKSLTKKKIGVEQLGNVIRKYALPEVRTHMKFIGTRNLQTGTIIAGTVYFYSPTHKSSVREAPFMNEEGRRTNAMTGIMDYWFNAAQKKGACLLVSTHFWQPGEPKGWKGFSTFKSHFDLQYVAYPPLLWRFVRGKFL